MELFCCKRNSCTSQSRWHPEKRKLFEHIEATSKDISQEDKAWGQMSLPKLNKLKLFGLYSLFCFKLQIQFCFDFQMFALIVVTIVYGM